MGPHSQFQLKSNTPEGNRFRKILSMALFFSLAVLVFSCGKKDVDCENQCLNGGVCNEGLCECPEGFLGVNCGSEETPHKMEITEVKVTRIPALNESDPWDTNGTFPDLKVALYYGNNSLHFSDEIKIDANPANKYTFTLKEPWVISNPTESIPLSLYDMDESETYQFMGGIVFVPYKRGSGFKETMIMDAGGKVAFEIKVKYYW